MTHTSQNRAIYLAGLLMPYFTIWLGLYVFKNAWATVLGYHAGIILLVTLARAWTSPREFRPSAPLWQVVLFGLTGCMAGILVYFLWPFIHVSPGLADAFLQWGLTSRTWPLFILYGTLINPWLEEIYWRGWLGSTARNPILHDAIFAGFHLIAIAPFFPSIWLVVAFLVLATSGWMWRQVIRTEKSMLASTLFHMASDVSILLVVWSTVWVLP
ncbi:MAG TPA: CPBP family glutamic-type intramembrane protease [Anaerolineales bacterium]|nr:CPBP family glutamic-type intramembrane protease [Anaerolineales bacterium]